MDNEILEENIENLEKVIGNLEDHIFDQNGLIDKLHIDINDAEEDINALASIMESYKKILEKKEQNI